MLRLYKNVVGLAMILTAGLSLSVEADGAVASFQGLGDLPGGAFYSDAKAVSADGSVVVGSSKSAAGTEAFYWTKQGGLHGLGDLPGGIFQSGANGVSSDGSVIVGSSKSGAEFEAFRWTADAGMVGLGDLAGGDFYSSAQDVSDDGLVIVGLSTSANGVEAFRMTEAGGMVGLGDLPGSEFYSTASATSADGAVVVGDATLGLPGEHGEEIRVKRTFRWSEATGMIDLGVNISATGVSADGSVVVGWAADSLGYLDPFRWTLDTGIVWLEQPGGGYLSRAFDISGDGSVIVGDSGNSGPPRAVIWDDIHGARYLQAILVDDLGLDLTGWTLEMAMGVSYDGQTIVGWGTNPNGDTEAFVATLPEPGVLVLMAVGATAVFSRRG